jgi:hypothetical protein
MKNELEYAASMEADFLSLFYSIRINRNSITLQGHLTKESLKRCAEFTRLELSEQNFLEGIYIVNDIHIAIVLTV